MKHYHNHKFNNNNNVAINYNYQRKIKANNEALLKLFFLLILKYLILLPPVHLIRLRNDSVLQECVLGTTVAEYYSSDRRPVDKSIGITFYYIFEKLARNLP